MAISYSSGIGSTEKSSVGIDRLRIDFDSNLRRCLVEILDCGIPGDNIFLMKKRLLI